MKPLVFFIVANGTNSSLTEDGWIFLPNIPLPANVVDKVTGHFNVQLVEEYLEVKKFQNEETQINVMYDDGAASEIYVRTAHHDRPIERVRDLLATEAVKVVDSRLAGIV